MVKTKLQTRGRPQNRRTVVAAAAAAPVAGVVAALLPPGPIGARVTTVPGGAAGAVPVAVAGVAGNNSREAPPCPGVSAVACPAVPAPAAAYGVTTVVAALFRAQTPAFVRSPFWLGRRRGRINLLRLAGSRKAYALEAAQRH